MAEATQVDILSTEVKRLEQTLNSAVARAEAAEKKLEDMNSQAVQAKLNAFAEDVKSRDEKINSFKAQVETEQKARTEAEAKVKELEVKNTELNAQITKANTDKLKTGRIANIVAELSMTQADAEKFYDSEFADLNLSDERFTKFVATIKTQKTPVVASTTPVVETKPAGEVLDNAVAENKPALGTEGVSNNVEETRADFAKFLATACLKRNNTKTE